MPKGRAPLFITLSALFATLLLCALALLVRNKLSIWGHLGTSEKVWTIIAAAYAVIMTASGWDYCVSGRRTLGFIHAALMLGVAGLVFVAVLRGSVASPGPDNAAAGILAAADFAFVAIGLLAAICGIVVMRCVFPGNEAPVSPQ
jgi:hypothetical protein